MKIEMSIRDVLMYVLTGIKAGRYNAAQKLLEDIIDSLDTETEAATPGRDEILDGIMKHK